MKKLIILTMIFMVGCSSGKIDLIKNKQSDIAAKAGFKILTFNHSYKINFGTSTISTYLAERNGLLFVIRIIEDDNGINFYQIDQLEFRE